MFRSRCALLGILITLIGVTSACTSSDLSPPVAAQATPLYCLDDFDGVKNNSHFDLGHVWTAPDSHPRITRGLCL